MPFSPAEAKSFGQIYNSISQLDSGILVSKLTIDKDPFTDVDSNIRRNSVSVEDFGLGDAGKGHTAQEVINLFIERIRNSRILANVTDWTSYSINKYRKTPSEKRILVISSRYNGSDNAGHEIVEDGIEIALHQLPIAVTQKDALGVIAKGMLLHPTNLVTEINYAAKKHGGDLNGELMIDQNVVVVTDLQRAFEGLTNQLLKVGKGATGSGIAQGYSTFYEKRAITMRDFMADDWEIKERDQYSYYANLFGGENILTDIEVYNLNEEGGRDLVKVGTEDEFIDKLIKARTELIKYVGDWGLMLEELWQESLVPIVFEGAQADALDPYHGIYPDITASRPIGRIGIPDSTEGIVNYDEIAVTEGVVKIPYFSSVGSRRPPYGLTREEEEHYRQANNEFGRSTGRPRGILPIDMELFQYTQRVGRKNSVGFTHLDSAVAGFPAKVVTGYINKGKFSVGYRPYQWHWDEVEGVVEDFPSWNGEEAGAAKEIKDIPREALVYMSAIAETMGVRPLMTTKGPNKGDVIFFFKP